MKIRYLFSLGHGIHDEIAGIIYRAFPIIIDVRSYDVLRTIIFPIDGMASIFSLSPKT